MNSQMDQNTIMIIDDNKSELRLLEEAYKESGFEYALKKFTDAKEALNYFVINARQVFMIICDISMPGMTGPELLDTINKNEELRMEAVPFIFFSNSNIKKDVLRAYMQSAQGYFQKPIGLDETIGLFKKIIDYWSTAKIPKD